MTFPLERHPGAIVFVDDDENYLAVIKDIFPPEWNILTFADATDFVDHVMAKMAVSKEMDAYQRGAIERYKKGGSVAIEVVRFWNAFPERYSLPQVVIIDYHMPSLNGLDALERVKEWSGQKILLTGVADEALICQALNERRIDYYIAKQNARIIQQTVSTVKLMLNNFLGTSGLKWSAWHMSMRSEQKLILQDPDITKALFEFVGEDFEHVVIGDPFGVMALGYGGGVKWLQMETTSTLDSAADLALKLGATNEEAHDVRAGRTLTDARINSALGIKERPNVAVNCFQVRIPYINEMIYGAVFDVSVTSAPPAEMCYSAWRARQQSL